MEKNLNGACKLKQTPTSLPSEIHFILPVWGEEYIGMFLNYALPSQLSENNLRAFLYSDIRLIYRIYTNEAGEEKIRASESFSRLANLMEIQFQHIDELLAANGPKIFTTEKDCHSHAIKEAEKCNAGTVMLNPDVIWANGSFLTLLSFIREGKYAILAPAVRVKKEPMIQFLDELRGDSYSLSLDSRGLVDRSLRNLHALSEGCCHGAEKYSLWAGHMYWKVGDEGIVARMCFSYLVYCRSKVKGHVPSISHDYDWMCKAVPDYSDYEVIADSDLAFAASLTPTVAPEWMPNQRNYLDCVTVIRKAKWLRTHAAKFTYIYLKTPVRIHSLPIADHWIEREAVFDKQAAKFLRALEKPNLFSEWCCCSLLDFIERERIDRDHLAACYNRIRLALGPYLPSGLRRKLKALAERALNHRSI